MFNLLFYILFIFFINFIFKKKKYFSSYSGSDHQKFINDQVPLTGGLFLVLPIFLIYYDKFTFFALIFFFIFLTGFLSDRNILSSPKKRFLLQIILISLFVFLNKLEVFPTRIEFIDRNFENTYISYFFTIFCLMILINGSNFIDGLNGLLLGYFLLILFILYKLNLLTILGFSDQYLYNLFIILIFIFVLNFINQLFLGDGGAYSLSFLFGFVLIYIYNSTELITPYFIILLLWYPCFENLFSIIRKVSTKKNPLEPDNNHLHQFIFIYLKNKFNLKSIYSNTLASLLINFYNFFIFFWASNNPNLTVLQIYLIVFNIIIYLSVYFYLKKLIFKKKFHH